MERPSRARIYLVAERNESFCGWLNKILSKNFEVKQYYLFHGQEKPPLLLKRWYLTVHNFIRAYKNFKPDKIFIFGKTLISLWLLPLIIRIFRLDIEIVVFRYDIEYFRPFYKGIYSKISFLLNRWLEKFCFIKSDKIIHKGLENELEYLPFYDKIKGKPHYLFREFLDGTEIQKYNPDIRLSKKDKEMHLVYVGGIHLKSQPIGDSIWEFYPKITGQKIHLHMYISTKFNDASIKKLNEISKKNRYFHFERPLPHASLIRAISKYDFGICLDSWNKSNTKNEYFQFTSFGNKYFDYISAKLPIIILNEQTPVVEFVDKYGIGWHISRSQLKHLKKLIRVFKSDYKNKIRNIENAIPKLLDCGKLLDFVGGPER